MPLRPSDEEIDQQMNEAIEAVDRGSNKWPGMTYEQGVHDALMWAQGHSEHRPMEDD